MKKLSAVLLLIVLCCSACSIKSKQVSVSSTDESSSNLSSQSDNDEVSSFETHAYNRDEPDSSSDSIEEIYSLPAPEDTRVDSDVPSTTPDYQGLTQEQWQKLQNQKEMYGDLSDEELREAAFNGEIECRNFIHLSWEHGIASQLIDYVNIDEFEHWVSEWERTGQCINIYSFAEHFSISQDELISLIEKNHLAQIYDLETVKNRVRQ